MNRLFEECSVVRSPALPALALGLLLAACASTNQQPESAGNDVRTTAETAPVEFQLACASEAPPRLGLPADSLLPTRSVLLERGLYQVDLTGGGVNATCIIDGTGNVQSVTQV